MNTGYAAPSPAPMGGPFPSESRTDCIYRHIRRMTRETRAAIEDYSLDVLEAWKARVPESIRHAHCADFKEHGPVSELMRANGKKIRRWMSEEVAARPSVDVEECLVLALPEPYRGECLRDLAARYGGLFVPVAVGSALNVGEAAALMRECGEGLQALAPLLTDGSIDANDNPERLRLARREMLDVQAVAAAVIARIDAALEAQAEPATEGLRRVK